MSQDNDDDMAEGIRITGATSQAGEGGDPDDDPFASWFEPDAANLVKPVTSSQASVQVEDEAFELQDWTAPPTGVVPKVVGGSDGPPSATGPVFRGAASPMSEVAVDFDDLAEEHLRVGALADRTHADDDDEWSDEWADYVEEHSSPVVSDYPDDEFDGPLEPLPRARTGSTPRTGATQRTGATPRAGAPRTGSTARARATGSTPRTRTGATSRVSRDADLDAPAVGPRPRRRPSSDGDRGRGTRSSAGDGVGGDRNIAQAAAIGIALLTVGVVCFLLGPWPTMLLITVVIVACAVELLGAMYSAGYNPAGLVTVAGTVGLMWGAFFRGPAAYPYVLGLIVVVSLIWFLVIHPGDQSVMNVGVTVFATLYIGGLGSFAALMAGFPNYTGGGSRDGIGLLLAAVLASVSYDVAGYFIGKSFGATPLGPTLRAASPNKTYEGTLGGMIVSVLVTMIFLSVAKLPILGQAGLGSLVVGLLALGCAFIAPLGDLCESMIKRDLDVKDMSDTLPGHGGVLDRFDGLLFVLPVAYFIASTMV